MTHALFLSLNSLFGEEYKLIKRRDKLLEHFPQVDPEGTFSACRKRETRKHVAKDGSQKTYEYKYTFLLCRGRQYYVPQKKSALALELSDIFKCLRAVRGSIRHALSLVNRPLSSKICERAFRKTYTELKRKADQNRKKRGVLPGDPGIITSEKDSVRSRCECIVANALSKLGAIYKYELPIIVQKHPRRYRYPDFTLYPMDIDAKNSGKPIYIEIWGMASDAQYMKEQENKLSDYKKNGVKLGQNLVIFRLKDPHAIDSALLHHTLGKILLGKIPSSIIDI